MYNLPYFKERDARQVMAFMKAHSFAMVMGVDENKMPVATQVPLLFSEKEGVLHLRGHIMKGNDHHKAFEKNAQVLVLFTGPHTYVSASWYEDKQQASTWNYMTVHARGELRLLNENALLEMLDELTAYYENNPESPSLYKELPDEYVKRLSKAIIAFDIKVNSIENVFKLSQNRDEKSYENIIGWLQQGDYQAKAIADEMVNRKEQLYTR